MGRYTQVVLDTCAYAGTGNVLKVQDMLHLCAEHLDEKAEHQVGGDDEHDDYHVKLHKCYTIQSVITRQPVMPGGGGGSV